MQIFYIPDIIDKTFSLSKEESIHCTKVLRLKKGDKISLVDGKGGFYKAEIIIPDPKKCSISIVSKTENYGKRNFYLHIAIAPTKNMNRFEVFLEKAVELGVDEITPLICSFSERKIIKNVRLKKIMISAIKQSKRAYLPKLNEAISFNNFINNSHKDQKFIAHCYERTEHLKNQYLKGEDATILIGPEGDFDKKELEEALKNGFNEISLGHNRYRTETAGIIAVHTVQLAND